MEHNNQLYLTSNEDILFDDNYRYKISTIEISYVFKKGTQITILDNFEIFCSQLMFNKETLLKIIGKTLSCKSGVDKLNNYYLQGKYDKEHIKSIIYSFIQNYLLCTNCDKPEINLKHKNNKIKQRCRACGNNNYLENCTEEIIHIFKKQM
jgi:translation initiation factor 2 beta subunit (eIF-2beta)/eIF-5